ncbi:hypothetical protein PIB30_027755 [Stylosanthes scabra]|uniref:Uncharacterized protein n=1 Tax=Stylosanthes scabra TaxID=79078 RepID=A0ABU6YAW1_9FABA|nr:hypothetical protein [Stylosanthes scabra]
MAWFPPGHPLTIMPPSRHNVILASPCTPWTAPTPRHGMAVARSLASTSPSHAPTTPQRGPFPLPSPSHAKADKQTLKFGVERSLLLLQGNSENRDIKGIDKEKKLGAKDNLKKKKQVKNYRVFEEGYRYLASGYRYPSTKLAQTKAKHESGVIQAQFHARTAFWPRLGMGFHHSPRLGVAGKPTSTPDRVTTK